MACSRSGCVHRCACGCVRQVATGVLDPVFSWNRGKSLWIAKEGDELHDFWRSHVKTRLGPPVVPFYPFFGEGSPTKIDYRIKLVPSYSNLSTGGPRKPEVFSRVFLQNRGSRQVGFLLISLELPTFKGVRPNGAATLAKGADAFGSTLHH